MIRVLLPAVLSLLGLLFAHSTMAGETLSVGDAWSRATPPGARNGVAYLVIDSPAKDRLLAVKVDRGIAAEAQIHDHVHENGMMKMKHLPYLDLEPGETALAPGGLHIMLMGLAAPLSAGQAVELTLEFDRAEAVTVSVPVRDARQ